VSACRIPPPNSRARLACGCRPATATTGRPLPLIIEAARALQGRSFLLEGEAVACDGDGVPVFARLRYRRQNRAPPSSGIVAGS
jgi:ATP-dependent DNA ligase